jgi:hypothetical protein
MLKLRNWPSLFQVLNYAIGPAQVRVMHDLFCLVNLPFDVGAACPYSPAETASHGGVLR